MTHKGTLPLETERLILRSYKKSDAETLYKNRGGDSLESIRAIFQNWWLNQYDDPTSYQWLIVLKSLGEPIGTIRAEFSDEEKAIPELGYEIGEEWWHQGIVTEAAKRVIAFFFEEVGVKSVAAHYSKDNPRSGGVLYNCGMTDVGIEEADNQLNGMIKTEITAEDYFKEQKA
jgi:ribosomal-protein-alanine N-acetyltransferase